MSEPTGTAFRVAEELRAQVISGELKPGTQLSEEKFRALFGVSRNTLREAYQLLIRDRLLVHELSRGVFVRKLSREDISDLYKVRRIVECGALRRITSLSLESLRTLAEVVEDSRVAARDLGRDATDTANIRFHEALVSFAECERLSDIMRGVLAEYRLVYGHLSDSTEMWRSYQERQAGIADALRSGDIDGAVAALDEYLVDAEAETLANYLD